MLCLRSALFGSSFQQSVLNYLIIELKGPRLFGNWHIRVGNSGAPRLASVRVDWHNAYDLNRQ